MDVTASESDPRAGLRRGAKAGAKAPAKQPAKAPAVSKAPIPVVPCVPKVAGPVPIAPPARPPSPSSSEDSGTMMAGAASSKGASLAPPPKKASPSVAKGRAAPVPRPAKIKALGGGHVLFHEFKDPATGKIYPNWRFWCPHHANCQKTLGVVPKNTRPHGDLQPLATLHVWRDQPPGPKGHIFTSSPPKAVAEFMAKHKAALQSLEDHYRAP